MATKTSTARSHARGKTQMAALRAKRARLNSEIRFARSRAMFIHTMALEATRADVNAEIRRAQRGGSNR